MRKTRGKKEIEQLKKRTIPVFSIEWVSSSLPALGLLSAEAHILNCVTVGQGNLIAQCLSFLISKDGTLVLYL